ncbi:MAG: type II toxin-antitoxin system RelE family toxin [Hyphomicrobium sp.]
MARVRLSRDAIAFLESLPQKQAQQIAAKIDGLEADPPQVLLEKLSGHAALFKVAA